MNLNKVFLIGRLTANPELKTTTSGLSVTGFGIATNRVWTDKSGARQEETEYHNVVVWGKQAEIATQFLTKGSLVMIEGRLRTRSWQDKQGAARKTTEIVCERIQFGPRFQGQGGAPGAPRPMPEKPESAPGPAEEVPTIDLEEGGGQSKPDDLPF